jgi:hypothetical protein
MTAPTIPTNFSRARNFGSPTGGQWHPATGGIQVPQGLAGMTPITGSLNLLTRQHSAVAQTRQSPQASNTPVPMAARSPATSTQTPGTNVGSMIAKGTGAIAGLFRPAARKQVIGEK